MDQSSERRAHLHRDTRLRFEQWARNPACMANAVSAVHGLPMVEIAHREGIRSTFGQSPFALARGQSFERSLFRDDASPLRDALIHAGVLPVEREGFMDFRMRIHGGPCSDLDDALARTVEFFRKASRVATKEQRRSLPSVLAGPVVRIPGGIMLPEAILVIDALVVRFVDGSTPELVVGEIKTYPDRGGYTDADQLATARAQAGVYVHGLRLVLSELRLADRISVASNGFLVLTRPGSSQPTIRADESFEYQARRAERGFQKLRDVAALIGGPRDPDLIYQKVVSSPIEYCEACVSFCDRAPICHAASLRSGKASVLGDDAAHFLGSVDLHRAIALMDGAAPANIAEQDLLRRIHELQGGAGS